jgi:membrane-associated phospholipid phosphatase
MTAPREPLLAWPGWDLLGRFLVLATLQTVWWVVVYAGCDYITGLHARRVRLHFDAELAIPFVPAMIVVYQSIGPVFWLAPFILRSRGELRGLAVGLAVVTGIAGVGFLVVPGELAYAPVDAGPWAPIYALNRRVVLTYNLLPSLHVAMSSLTLLAYAMRVGIAGKCVFVGWAGAIALSTLLIHEHHVADVVAGLILAWAAFRFVYLPMAHRKRSNPP